MKKYLLPAIAAAFAATLGCAHAEQMGDAKLDMGNAYILVSAGALVPNNVSLTLGGSYGGTAVSGSGHYTFNVGEAFTAILGYHYNDHLAGEFQLGYAGFDYNTLNGSYNISGIASGSGSIAIGGHVDTVVGLSNIIVTPLGRNGFSPYVGGGLGVAVTNENISSIDGYGVSGSATGTNFAADIVGGFNYTVNSSIDVGLRYQYFWADTGHSNNVEGITSSTSSFSAHLITATSKFHF